MINEKTILVLDDNPESRQSTHLILGFISELSITSSIENWLEGGCKSILANPLGMILVHFGAVEEKNSLRLGALLKRLHDIHGSIPVALIDDEQLIPEDVDTKIRQMVVARIPLPMTYNDLNDAIHRAQRFNEAIELANESGGRRPLHLFRSLVGTSRLVKNVRVMMAQVADKDVTVMIEGESGTGKEVVARNLHYHSERRDGPFVPVNCGAIPSELLESELFGHEKGAFTGAVTSRAGRFEMAEGGTLFLDEIGDMPLHMQVKILRVLQEKTYERVGGNKMYKTNVRIIAATHRHLEKMIEEGKFREDLFYRLNVFPIEMPSLRERSEDIPLLINELVSRLEHEKRGSIRFSSTAVLSLCRHPWPGNVRELANLVERMAIMHPANPTTSIPLPSIWPETHASRLA